MALASQRPAAQLYSMRVAGAKQARPGASIQPGRQRRSSTPSLNPTLEPGNGSDA